MSFCDDARQLELSFRTTRELLQRLLKSLEQRRAAWISVRASVVRPDSEIEEVSGLLAAEEDRRAGLLQRLRLTLPGCDGVAVDHQHVNVTRIAAALPQQQARSLREANDAVQPLARRVRAEVTLGQRLLRFAQHTNTGFAAELAGAAGAQGSTSYDRRARNVHAAGSGRLVDGRI
ncbi:MAG: hypothetical protein R3F29_11310 [Planctomycetota bacterium]